MTRKTFFNLPVLGGVLALQVVLAVLLWHNSGEQTATVEPLFASPVSQAERLELASAEATVTLLKESGQWQLENGLPVENTRVQTLLDKIAELKSGWPQATTESAQARFEVSEENFNRRVQLYQGDQLINTLYLGSSVSFKQVHVRKEGDENIYTGKLSAYEIPTSVNAWMDTTVLRPAADIQVVQAGDFRIKKQNGAWPDPKREDALAETAQAQAHDSEQVTEAGTQGTSFDAEAFANTLANLRVTGVVENISELDAEEVEGQSKDENVLKKIHFSVSTSEGELSYHLLSKQNSYYIRRGDYPHTFKITKSTFDQLAQIAEHKA